jgi:uncharacterized membrane protein YsdA (DUF1294 family)
VNSTFILFTLFATLFTAILGISLHSIYGIGAFPSYLLAVNLTTFILYGYDKLISGTKMLRVPEKVLHLFALALGSPAAFLAQRAFRHKTVKKSFRIVFNVTIILQSILAGAYTYWKYIG